MASFKGTTRQTIDASYTKARDLTTPTEPIGIEQSQAWTSGTGDLQANRFFADSKAISSIDNIDLSGVLEDAFGNTLTMTAIKELWIRNTSAVSGEDLTIAGTWFLNSVLTGFVDDAIFFTLERGAAIRWVSPYAGWDIDAGTKDILSITPATGTITYEIAILGVE